MSSLTPSSSPAHAAPGDVFIAPILLPGVLVSPQISPATTTQDIKPLYIPAPPRPSRPPKKKK